MNFFKNGQESAGENSEPIADQAPAPANGLTENQVERLEAWWAKNGIPQEEVAKNLADFDYCVETIKGLGFTLENF